MIFDPTNPQPGLYPYLPNEQYHGSPGISKSGLALLRKTPAHYAAKYIHGAWDEPTQAMIIGSAFHTITLEPHKFNDGYAVGPAVDRRTKAGKAEWEEFVANSGGRTVIALDDYELIQDMAAAVYRHPGASHLLGLDVVIEESIYWVDYATDLLCKCRPDIRIPSRRLLVDLKSCEDASPEEFSKSIYNFTYYLQGGFYCEGTSVALRENYETFVFIAVEKKPPHFVAVYELDEYDIGKGKLEASALLSLYKWCSDRNEWPGYGDTIQTISMPKWARNREVAIYD